MLCHFLIRRSLALRSALCVLMVLATGCTPPEPAFWSDSERAVLRSLSIASLPPRPASQSNRVADDPRAVVLGQALFFDTRLSAAGDQSCASCHQPDKYFTDGRARGRGVKDLTRNTPGLIGAAWQTWFYWDGRRDSLWAQALIPIEAPDEMAGSRMATVRLVTSDPTYREQYSELFGAVPPVLNHGDLPAHAGAFTDAAGKDAWLRLPLATRQDINRVYANIGKTIAAFERTLVPQPNRFDHYVSTLLADGEAAAGALLAPAERNGAKLFIDATRTRCLQCHSGPLLTNGGFHNIGSGGASGENLDFGRMFGVQSVLLDEFNCNGPYSDAAPDDCSALRFLSREQHGDTAGAFKVPSLRNVGETAPYFHDGRFATLEDVMQHYIAPPADGSSELVALALTATQVAELSAFLRTLSAPAPSAPLAWSASEKALHAWPRAAQVGAESPDYQPARHEHL